MEQTNCKICGSDDKQVLVDKVELCQKAEVENLADYVLFHNNKPVNYRHVICKNCGLVYMTPRLSRAEMQRYFCQKYSDKRLDETQTDVHELSPVVKKRLGFEIYSAVSCFDFLSAHDLVKRGHSSLDVGSSLGALSAYLDKQGMLAAGLELTALAKQTSALFGNIPVFQQALEDFVIDKRFDLITVRDVFAYFSNPQAALEKLRLLLKDDGHLVLEVPDIFKPAGSVFDFVSNQSLYCYSSNSIRNLLCQTGFVVLEQDYSEVNNKLRFLLAKGPIAAATYRDSWQELREFIVRYDTVFRAWQQCLHGSCSYQQARERIQRYLPEFMPLEFYQASRFFLKQQFKQARDGFLRCLHSNFNQEFLSLQAGSIEGYLAYCDYRLGNYYDCVKRIKTALQLLPRIYDFPYLARLEVKQNFSITDFIVDANLPYEQLFELQSLFVNNNYTQNYGAGH